MDKKSNKIVKILKEYKKRVKEKINLNKIILFGSRARGEERKNSDVDLIIVSKDFNGEKSFKRPAKFYLEWDYDYETDIICLTPEEFKKKRMQIGIIQNALKEGIEI